MGIGHEKWQFRNPFFPSLPYFSLTLMNYQQEGSEFERNRLKRTNVGAEICEIFADSIRQQHRQQIFQTIREKTQHLMPLSLQDPQYEPSRMLGLHKHCSLTCFSRRAVREAVDYIIEERGRIMQEQATAFVREFFTSTRRRLWGEDEPGGELLHTICNQVQLCECECEGCEAERQTHRIRDAVDEVLRKESMIKGWGSEEEKVERYLYELVECCGQFPSFLCSWQHISTIDRGPEFLAHSLPRFSRFIERTVFLQLELEQQRQAQPRVHQQLQTQVGASNEQGMVLCIFRVTGNYLSMMGNYKHLLPLCVDILERVLSKFILESVRLLELIDLLILVLDSAQEEPQLMDDLIHKIAVGSALYRQICHLTFQNKELRGQQIGSTVISRASLLAGRLFASTEDLSDSVYMANMLILKHLRMWLPLPPLPLGTSTPPNLSNIPHQFQENTLNIAYCLSNIVGTSVHFCELCINTDIFLALVVLYKYVPVSTRTEIAHFLHNIFYLAPPNLLTATLHQTRHVLIDLLRDMLEEKKPVILRLVMDVVTFICQGLPTHPPSTSKGGKAESISGVWFTAEMQKSGCLCLIESHASSKAERVSEASNRALLAVQELSGEEGI